MKIIAVITLAIAAAAAQAQTSTAPVTSAGTPAALTEGEVRKVDKDAGKLTLRHGRIENLDMPPMTMVFRAAEPKLLDGLKEGDKVRFAADRVNGAITVTRIEAAR
jgi:Cu(I)/Ag(I) efflux system periplasmic protein CusF